MSNSKKSDTYNKFLTSMHGKLNTPEEIVHDVVKEGTGLNFSKKEKIIVGEINEVYEITLSNDQQVILRISHDGPPNFQQEKWAINKCKNVGVPVPEILSIKYVTISGKQHSMCLMKKIEGEPLQGGKIDYNKLDLETKRNLINQAGEILSKIHSLSTTGFGWITGGGKAEFPTAEGLLMDKINSQDKLEKIATEEDIDHGDIKKAIGVLNKFIELYSQKIPNLNHGDFSLQHFMVKNNKIVGILDWGSVRSDTPVYDFSTWDYWFGDEIPTEWLKESYRNQSLFDDNFNGFLHMQRIFNGLEILDWYHQKKYKPNIDIAKKKLAEDLKYFN